MIPIEENIKSFDPITLEEMDSVKLMDRRDTKFIFNAQSLPSLLEELTAHYKILEISNKRGSQYETLYFDTDDFQFYTQHHNGKLNRYKVRFRRYVEVDKTFLEVKFKSNKARTIKKRIKRINIKPEFKGRSKDLIEGIIKMNADLLKPKLWVNYTRITLVQKDFQERVTIDLDLTYKVEEEELKVNNLVIAEVKQGAQTLNSPIIQFMRNAKIQPLGFSKILYGNCINV
ncbi:MAG: polyphosphate polymerase domain-containing protein [Bacteroidia bacterium]|nr:polyphosphate polymerase domain-containing protein [Bacteroidia bacterium]